MGGFFSSPEPESSSGPSQVKSPHNSVEWGEIFYSLKDSSKLLVIDFTASWCGPCKMMAPVFAQLSTEFTDVQFVKIDVDELKDVAQEFGVRAMPTFVLVKQGKKIDEVVGANKDELKNKINQYR
ncbi:hypothetical protein Scep_021721 [Stephania cephalantha]|uniref:Thioredoxin domain-containing protein n=1 Tax=Stephania cephalantha TaxID=152367 RepID=A0AAP0I0G1_9MAGN